MSVRGIDIDIMYFRNRIQETLVRKLIHKSLHLCPFWVRRITASRCDDEGKNECVLSVNWIQHYKEFHIDVYDRFFSQPEESQIRVVQHEIVHIHTAEMVDWVRNHMIPCITQTNEDLAKTLADEFTVRMESSTESITILLNELVKGKQGA